MQSARQAESASATTTTHSSGPATPDVACLAAEGASASAFFRSPASSLGRTMLASRAPVGAAARSFDALSVHLSVSTSSGHIVHYREKICKSCSSTYLSKVL